MKGTNVQVEKAHGKSIIVNEKRPTASSNIMKFQTLREQKRKQKVSGDKYIIHKRIQPEVTGQ